MAFFNRLRRNRVNQRPKAEIYRVKQPKNFGEKRSDLEGSVRGPIRRPSWSHGTTENGYQMAGTEYVGDGYDRCASLGLLRN
jgi:hypothetical protein